MRIVTLVPWRGGNDYREWCWDVCRPYVEELGYPLFAGDAPGPWSRAQAVNNIANEAGKWDVALINDADTVLEEGAVRRTVAWVKDTRGAARPHDWRWMLNPQGTIYFAQTGPHTPNAKHLGRMYGGGGALIVHREAWERVGGFDDSFIGWGHEDSALNIALLREASYDRLPGEAWHLWHPTDDNKPNVNSVSRYRKLIRDNRNLIRAWSANKGVQGESIL